MESPLNESQTSLLRGVRHSNTQVQQSTKKRCCLRGDEIGFLYIDDPSQGVVLVDNNLGIRKATTSRIGRYEPIVDVHVNLNPAAAEERRQSLRYPCKNSRGGGQSEGHRHKPVQAVLVEKNRGTPAWSCGRTEICK